VLELPASRFSTTIANWAFRSVGSSGPTATARPDEVAVSAVTEYPCRGRPAAISSVVPSRSEPPFSYTVWPSDVSVVPAGVNAVVQW
jgi:hypothetical protein